MDDDDDDDDDGDGDDDDDDDADDDGDGDDDDDDDEDEDEDEDDDDDDDDDADDDGDGDDDDDDDDDDDVYVGWRMTDDGWWWWLWHDEWWFMMMMVIMIMMTVMVVINMISNSHCSSLHALQRIRCKHRHLPPGAWRPKTQDMAKISATLPSLPQWIGASHNPCYDSVRTHGPWSTCRCVSKLGLLRFTSIRCLTCLYFLTKVHQFKPADNSHPRQEISSSNHWFSGARGHLLVFWQGVYELYPFSSGRKLLPFFKCQLVSRESNLSGPSHKTGGRLRKKRDMLDWNSTMPRQRAFPREGYIWEP